LTDAGEKASSPKTGDPSWTPAGDRYVPIHFKELRESVAEDLFPQDREALLRVAWLLENRIEFEMGEVEETLKDAYMPFCPDDPCVTRIQRTPEILDLHHRRFWEEMERMFERANFEKIDREMFKAAVKAGTTKGLRVDVDLDQYRDFALYYRGLGEADIEQRGVKTKFRKRMTTVPIYRRAVIITGMKDEPHIHIRLYKEIPVRDIESLLPGTKLRMRVLDKVKLTGTGGAAVYSGFRIALQGAILVGKTFLLPLVFVAMLIYIGRTVLHFFKIRDQYQKNLIKDLFFQSLDSNLGAINRLVDTTEEEECKEAFLAYAFAAAEGRPVEPKVLKERIQAYLKKGWNVEVTFDLDDAIRKIETLQLGSLRDGRLSVRPFPEALEVLDRAWDDIYSFNG
jgi:hypothetical protein